MSGGDGTSSVTKCKAKHAMLEVSSPPCGACKYQRKKCTNDCMFAPYFGSDHGLAQFTIVHKIFGASNVLKMLLDVEVNRRQEAMRSILFEAQARLIDPVNGCLSTMIGLQQQVASLQGELAMVKNQLINTKILYEELFNSTYQQQQQLQPNINVAGQPYSNNSPASTNFMNMNGFNSNFDHLGMQTTPLTDNLKPLQFSELPQNEEENMILQVSNNDMTHLLP
ncbi:LOB domain-containing protein 20 [Cajanus cajan]|uniref:LOB domain-containing protein 20 n=1 Tax=Cajanus cajan TaxID=3821 RepID=A0A151TA05_CAJCA|nr:LOB domain-containing protein 20 [Cajanus cajan]KYP63871.1 LOB domain-containing protein 20 [Cajanus cajan]